MKKAFLEKNLFKVLSCSGCAFLLASFVSVKATQAIQVHCPAGHDIRPEKAEKTGQYRFTGYATGRGINIKFQSPPIPEKAVPADSLENEGPGHAQKHPNTNAPDALVCVYNIEVPVGPNDHEEYTIALHSNDKHAVEHCEETGANDTFFNCTSFH